MQRMLILVAGITLIACASKERRTYPDNGFITYMDLTTSPVGGNLDSTGIRMFYKGAVKDSIEELGVIEAKVSGRGKTRNDVLRALQQEALKLKGDGILEITTKRDDDTWKADGVAFRFKQ